MEKTDDRISPTESTKTEKKNKATGQSKVNLNGFLLWKESNVPNIQTSGDHFLLRRDLITIFSSTNLIFNMGVIHTIGCGEI